MWDLTNYGTFWIHDNCESVNTFVIDACLGFPYLVLDFFFLVRFSHQDDVNVCELTNALWFSFH